MTQSDTPDRFIQGEERWSSFAGHGFRMRYLYLKAERPSGLPAVVFIHGFLGYSFSWRFNMQEFARTRDVYAVDLLGIGYSDRPPFGAVSFTLADSAQRMLGWLQELGLSDVDLVGTSHGGALSMVMAALDAAQPRRAIGRLILVAPANPYSRTGRKRLWFFNTRFGAWFLRFSGGGKGGVKDWALGRMYGDIRKLTGETRRGYRTMLAQAGSLDYALAVIRTFKKDLQEIFGLIPEITDIPTLIVWGEKDITVPRANAEPLAAHFRHVRLVIMPGSGHLPYEEDPALFNREVLSYLDDTSCAKAGA